MKNERTTKSKAFKKLYETTLPKRGALLKFEYAELQHYRVQHRLYKNRFSSIPNDGRFDDHLVEYMLDEIAPLLIKQIEIREDEYGHIYTLDVWIKKGV